MALIDRLLVTLVDQNKTLSTKQAAARFRVPAHSVRARISDLKTLGYVITTTQRRTTAGRNQNVYAAGI